MKRILHDTVFIKSDSSDCYARKELKIRRKYQRYSTTLGAFILLMGKTFHSLKLVMINLYIGHNKQKIANIKQNM